MNAQPQCFNPDSFAVAPGAVGRLLAWLHLALRLQRERRELSDLPPHLLADIGLTDGEAAHEAGRSFGDIPANRLRLARRHSVTVPASQTMA